MTDPDMLAEIKAKRLPPEGLKLGISKEDVEWLLARVEALEHENADIRTWVILSEEEGDRLRAALTLSDREADAQALEQLAVESCCCQAHLRGPVSEQKWHSDACESFHALYDGAELLRRRAGMTP